MECSMCNQTFSSNRGLHIHQARIHPRVDNVDIKQNDPVVNTVSEAKPTSSRASSVSIASSSRKRQRTSSERDHEEREEKKNPLEALAKLLMTDTELTAFDTRPIQGYVKREKYECLRRKYNDLQAKYTDLQERYRLTLDCLGSLGDSGVETDANGDDNEHSDENALEDEEEALLEDNNDAVAEIAKEELADDNEMSDQSNDEEEVSEEDNEEVPEDNNDKAPQESEDEVEDVIVNPSAYVSDVQWDVLVRARTVQFFVESAAKIIFDKKVLVASNVADGEPSSVENSDLDKTKMEIFRVLLEKYLEERQPSYTGKEKAAGKSKWIGYLAAYILRLKQYVREGKDITYC